MDFFYSYFVARRILKNFWRSQRAGGQKEKEGEVWGK